MLSFPTERKKLNLSKLIALVKDRKGKEVQRLFLSVLVHSGTFPITKSQNWVLIEIEICTPGLARESVWIPGEGSLLHL